MPDGAPRAVVIACGALGAHIREIAARRGWRLELHFLPALLHNHPARIAPEAQRLARAAKARGLPVALGYADCGSYGALDELCARLGIPRLGGLHCYDVLGGAERLRKLLEAEPGTYVLTDFLVRGFRRLVLAELGLDAHPELWPDYFGHYRRVVWLAQSGEESLEREARRVAEMFGLPLVIIGTGTTRLERELEQLLAAATAETSPAATAEASAATAETSAGTTAAGPPGAGPGKGRADGAAEAI